ncbi:uncharacterized protein [Euphorbia lathyris]|uniref:uncharacterized protein n=1 Tax=Euphorbia lathyris TaxID=212925 RepID=UPI0033132AD2
MVVSLGPGKFYGSSLPRPRIYTDVKFNSERVDPPASVMDPFYTWAEEAHWSMGGLSFKRLRLQGRIEGNVNKLRKQREKQAKERAVHSPKATVPAPGRVRVNGKGVKKERLRSGSSSESESDSPSPPPAPKITKRRRFVGLLEEESEEEVSVMEMKKKRKPARKLAADFEEVANESPIGMRTRRRGMVESGNSSGVADAVMKVVEELNKENSVEKAMKAGKKGKNRGDSRSRSKSKSSPTNSVRVSPRLSKKT